MARIQTVTRKDVLETARRLAGDYGESLTLTAFRRETGLSQWAIFDLFGSWKELRVAVGLTPEAPRRRNKITREGILELARRLAAQHGELLTEWLFLQETGLSGRVVRDRFGSWGAVREAVGLKKRARPRPRYTEEELLEDLWRAWRYNGTPRYHKHRWNGGQISPCTFIAKWGRWPVVVAAYEGYRRQKLGIQNPMPEGTPWAARRWERPGEGSDGEGGVEG